MFYPDEPIINGSTIAAHLGNSTDRLCGTIPRNFDRVPVGSIVGAPAAPETFTLTPRDAWPDLISDMERTKSRSSDMIVDAGIPVLPQDSLSYCWGFSCGLAVMGTRAQEGQPLVMLSPSSICAPVNGFQDGGNYIGKALEQVIRVGIASQDFVPRIATQERDFKTGWQDDAAKYRAKEFWDLGRKDSLMFDRVMTILLARQFIPVAFNWWRHSVCLCDPVMLGRGRFGVRLRNSWPNYGSNGFAVLEEGYGTPDEAYALRSIRMLAA